MAKKKEWNQEAAIYSALRRTYRSSTAVKAALEDVKEVYYIKSKHGKDLRRVRFTCADCGQKFSKKQIQVDHIYPVVDPLDGNLLPDGTRDWIKQIRRLFVSKEGLQIICKPDHNRKSALENLIRKQIKKGKNDSNSV